MGNKASQAKAAEQGAKERQKTTPTRGEGAEGLEGLKEASVWPGPTLGAIYVGTQIIDNVPSPGPEQRHKIRATFTRDHRDHSHEKRIDR